MKKLVFSIHTGPSLIETAWVDQAGEVVLAKEVKREELVNGLSGLHAFLKNALSTIPDGAECVGIGISTPWETLYPELEDSIAGSSSWQALAENLSKQLGVPVQVNHPARAAASLELLKGMGKTEPHFMSVFIGEQLWLTVVNNGNIVGGQYGQAGNLGKTLYGIAGIRERGRQTDRLEAYVSIKGARQLLASLMPKFLDKSDIVHEAYDQLTYTQLIEYAEKNDPLAIAMFERMGSILGSKLGDVVAQSSPSVVVLSGSLCWHDSRFYASIRTSIDKNVLNIFKGKCRVTDSDLAKENYRLQAAAALCWIAHRAPMV